MQSKGEFLNGSITLYCCKCVTISANNILYIDRCYKFRSSHHIYHHLGLVLLVRFYSYIVGRFIYVVLVNKAM